MDNDITKHIKPTRLNSLPEAMRRELKAARLKRGWSQARLGQHIGLPQMHISGIETGKIVPRFDTLLDLVRVLDFDLLMVPRSLVPAVLALIRDQGHDHENEERPLYAGEEEPEGQERHDEV
jgi:transcriptional regulator with XRE-family HTH domain